MILKSDAATTGGQREYMQIPSVGMRNGRSSTALRYCACVKRWGGHASVTAAVGRLMSCVCSVSTLLTRPARVCEITAPATLMSPLGVSEHTAWGFSMRNRTMSGYIAAW
eukprot:4420459-Pleurochrysis_carterae.AAC.2